MPLDIITQTDWSIGLQNQAAAWNAGPTRPNDHRIEVDGVLMTLAYAARTLKISYNVVHRRIGLGWPVSIALLLPPGRAHRHKCPTGPPTATPGYEVTADGRVFSVGHNWRGYGRREMKQTPNSDGYPSVKLTINGKKIRLAVHKLVALWFLTPRPSPKHEIRHLDGDKWNRSAANLAWGTQKDNADDRERHGRTYHMTSEEARAKSARANEVRRAKARANV